MTFADFWFVLANLLTEAKVGNPYLPLCCLSHSVPLLCGDLLITSADNKNKDNTTGYVGRSKTRAETNADMFSYLIIYQVISTNSCV